MGSDRLRNIKLYVYCTLVLYYCTIRYYERLLLALPGVYHVLVLHAAEPTGEALADIQKAMQVAEEKLSIPRSRGVPNLSGCIVCIVCMYVQHVSVCVCVCVVCVCVCNGG